MDPSRLTLPFSGSCSPARVQKQLRDLSVSQEKCKAFAEAEAIPALPALHSYHVANFMHAWPDIDSEVKRSIRLRGPRAQQTCSNRLFVRPLGFCSLCIRVHLWQTAPVKHILPCHAGRSQMKSPAKGRQYGRLERVPRAPHACSLWAGLGLSGYTLSQKHEARLPQAQKACLCW